MNWSFIGLAVRLVIWRPHLKSAWRNQTPATNTFPHGVGHTLTIRVAGRISTTIATGLTTHRVWTAEAVATIWMAVALAKGIATMISVTTAARLPTDRIRTTITTPAVFHTLTLTIGIARVGGGTYATRLPTDWVGATLKVAAIWYAAIFLTLTI